MVETLAEIHVQCQRVLKDSRENHEVHRGRLSLLITWPQLKGNFHHTIWYNLSKAHGFADGMLIHGGRGMLRFRRIPCGLHACAS